MRDFWEGSRIVGLTISAAILFGIVHDQVTARLCLEYFTIGHPPILGGTKSPTLVALGWGVLATWIPGAFVGVILALASRIGSPPKHDVRSLVRPIAILFSVMAASSIVNGFVGWHETLGHPQLMERVPLGVPPDRRALFVADWFAHMSAYAVGFAGGIALAIYAAVSRWWEGRRQTAGPSDSKK